MSRAGGHRARHTGETGEGRTARVGDVRPSAAYRPPWGGHHSDQIDAWKSFPRLSSPAKRVEFIGVVTARGFF